MNIILKKIASTTDTAKTLLNLKHFQNLLETHNYIIIIREKK